ncbi:methyltransferase, FkbM family protein [Halogeometricum pallidum JCM 14848]|uniref:Methyltransferase, FkbM family protein n=1 Tax=Halogeometricum pallidum JCM 14848 TaxID=1227487 RepID=M0D8I0_HALPD|nr:FkbM family methyltransferase [Halogeometricum pallidum]ELZ31810.1 methyltransferase, FkbM family protein [Halogeometricum pallidum JCM 14848]
MSLRNDVRARVRGGVDAARRVVVDRIAGTSLADAARRSGLTSTLTDLTNRAAAVVLPNEVVFRVGEEETRFKVSTRFEYEGFAKYRTDPDRTVLERFVKTLRSDDVLWDVGAHVGVYSVLAAGRLPPEHVVAIEPHPENVDRLRENLERNGRDATVRRLALDDECGRAELGVSSPDGTGAFGTLNKTTSQRNVAVQTDRGDSLVADGVSAPTVLKIDVQGAELDVLRGLRHTLLGCRAVYVNVYEKHFSRGDEGEEIRDVLESAGLTVERLVDWDGGHFLAAVREP